MNRKGTLWKKKRNDIRNEVWGAYHDYQTSVKSYEVSKKVLKSAEENEKVAFTSYEIGKTDIINLLTAESQLADARDALVNAFYTVLIIKRPCIGLSGDFNVKQKADTGKKVIRNSR